MLALLRDHDSSEFSKELMTKGDLSAITEGNVLVKENEQRQTMSSCL